MDINDLLQFIRKITLFSIFSDEELAQLTRVAELKSISAGGLIFDQGTSGKEFYLVYSGKVRIVQKNEKKQEINLGVRTRGDHFGETALITDKARNAAARAAEDSVLVSIDRQLFYDYFYSKPELREYFDKFIRYTSIHQFLKSCTELSSVPPQQLQALVQNFHSEFFKEGDVVFRQGAEPDKFYLVESGKLKVVRWGGKSRQIINFLREGDFFGEKALVEDSRRYADVVCLTNCTLFSLSKETFYELVPHSPKIKKVFEDRIRSYLTDKPPIPYQEIIKQEMAALQDIHVQKGDSQGNSQGASKGTSKDASKRASRGYSGEEASPLDEKPGYGKRFSTLYYRNIHFPFIMQHDQMTCGTTCLMMIARYYGKNFSSSRLRELAHVDLSGSSLANLASAAEQLGFSTRGMKLRYDTLIAVHLPCIVHWQGYHYVVVYRASEKNVRVADPALGLRIYTREKFLDNWNGITLSLEPTPEFEKQTEDKTSFRNFIQFVRPYKLILLEILVASILMNLFGLATPIFTQNVIDKVLFHHNASMLNIMLTGMVLVLIFQFLVSVLRQYLIVHTSMKIDLRMLVAFYKHMLSLPLGYYKVRKVGDFISRFGENKKIRSFLTNTALTMVLDTILISVYLSLMFYYNVQMTGLALLFMPIFITITLIFTPMFKKLNVDSFAAQAESESHLIESVNGIDTVKAMNIEYPTRWKWEDKYIKSLNIDFKLFNTAIYFHSLGDFVGALSSTIILWYGAQKVMQGTISVGELMAFMALMGSVITPVNRIITAWDTIQQTMVSVDLLNDVFTAKAEFSESMEEATGLVISEPRGEIAFENVYFRYGGENDAYILSNITLRIAPGQTAAIVGRSGSGKSTLVKLIARFYDVTEGKISIDGCDLKNIDLTSLRNMVGFILQDNFIFNASIRENISFGDPEETMGKVIEAARLANAHDFISGLGQGYETRVGDSGLQLSGGQKQRIAIARVLYRNPKIIIFDEATSSLDTESEQAIQKNMRVILQGKTALIIAHRLSTVRNADIIFVIDNGEIIEQGTHEELMKRRGLYHYLNHQQLNL
ncbi:MAG: peptidase domain-containing ABC transporter [bacterium]